MSSQYDLGSAQHHDRNQAKGFNLLRWNKNADLEFVGRHLLDPVDSSNESYISSKVQEQLKGSSVTVVLIGKKTHDSEWVKYEIESSLNKDNPNSVLGIFLPDGRPRPADSLVGKALHDAGVEIIDWDPHRFADAIERAAKAAGRARAIRAAGTSSDYTSCAR